MESIDPGHRGVPKGATKRKCCVHSVFTDCGNAAQNGPIRKQWWVHSSPRSIRPKNSFERFRHPRTCSARRVGDEEKISAAYFPISQQWTFWLTVGRSTRFRYCIISNVLLTALWASVELWVHIPIWSDRRTTTSSVAVWLTSCVIMVDDWVIKTMYATKRRRKNPKRWVAFQIIYSYICTCYLTAPLIPTLHLEHFHVKKTEIPVISTI